MNVPHSLVVDDCANALYVADRESSAVQRFALEDGHHERTVDLRRWGPVYAITMGPYGTLLALCWQRGGAAAGASVVHINPYDGALHLLLLWQWLASNKCTDQMRCPRSSGQPAPLDDGAYAAHVSLWIVWSALILPASRHSMSPPALLQGIVPSTNGLWRAWTRRMT